ncbi:MAG: hypothetical protein FLDDKLPJ_01354 [Phycisphaerae bacterium]|nr:hypothetical protein [Phycisphaerae bacterium]
MTKRFLRRRCALTAVVAGLSAASASAALYTWTGNVDNDWTTTGNWSSSSALSAPGASDDVVINDTYPRSTVIVDTADRTVRNAFIGDGMTLQLDYNLTVSAAGHGKLETSGAVALVGSEEGSKTLSALWHVVFSRTTATEVTTDAGARLLVE